MRGLPFAISYLQTGPAGQGRIRIEASEVERLLDAMRVQPLKVPSRRMPLAQRNFPGINVKLGLPPD